MHYKLINDKSSHVSQAFFISELGIEEKIGQSYKIQVMDKKLKKKTKKNKNKKKNKNTTLNPIECKKKKIYVFSLKFQSYNQV